MAIIKDSSNINCPDRRVQSAAFEMLTDEQLRKVDKDRTELTYRKGELLCKQGMYMSNIIFIRGGSAKLYLENDNHVTIINIEKPGSFIGVQALYGEDVFPFSAEALTDTEVCLNDINVFRELVVENAPFGKEIIRTLNRDLLKSYNRLFSLTTKQIHGRFSELLLFLSNVLYESNPFKLTISRQDMANLISTSPESVSRLISEFKEEGIIKSKGHTIEILDNVRLNTISNKG